MNGILTTSQIFCYGCVVSIILLGAIVSTLLGIINAVDHSLEDEANQVALSTTFVSEVREPDRARSKRKDSHRPQLKQVNFH